MKRIFVEVNDMSELKRMAAIHDLSGLGKCSITAALPIVSASGVECCCIPTALLSTHTGGFTGWTFRDLSEDMVPIAKHWNSLGMKFDAVYSGYLASPEQGELLCECIDLLSDEATLVIVDPAMADNGRYYANLGPDMTECFKKIIGRADIITPNMTEACFLTGTEYRSVGNDDEFVERLLDALTELGPETVVITGVCSSDGEVGIVGRDSKNGEVCRLMSPARNGTFHGSGDVFASALSALLVRGFEFERALRLAQEFVADCVDRTERRCGGGNYGLDFESALPRYIAKINE